MKRVILLIPILTALCLALPMSYDAVQNRDRESMPESFEVADQVSALIFWDDFETGDLSKWTASQSDETSISDSPGSLYLPSTDSWVCWNSGNPINLAGTTSPELIFWWYGRYFDDWDYMKVEASLDSATWDSLWSTEATDTMPPWAEVNVDLTPYSGSSVYLRFFVHSTSVVEYDGGHYNNLYIKDDYIILYWNSCDDMNDVTTGGTNDTWGTESESPLDDWLVWYLYPYEGTYHALGGFVQYKPNEDSYIEAMGVDLSGTTTAELTCYANWVPNDTGDLLTVEVDDGGGWVVAGTIGETDDYELQTINLNSFTGGLVDIRFHLVSNGAGESWIPLIDMVEVNTDISSLTPATWGEIKTLF